MRIHLVDAASLGYCNRGCRAFCQRHNLDWSDFVINGADVSLVEHIDDDMVRELIKEATRRSNHGQK